MATATYDVLGVGFGPSNIALAVALEEQGFDGSVMFIERNPGNSWQQEMMLGGSDIQHNPLRDLVTPSNPRSRYGWLSYLAEAGRLFDFLNLPIHYPLRSDYDGYVRWVADQFPDWVRHGTSVASIAVDPEGYRVQTTDGDLYRARSLVVGTGRSPYLPEVFAGVDHPAVFHLTRYLSKMGQLQARPAPPRKIAVVGGSQSAVELLIDLRERFPETEVHGLCRSYGYQSKDTSPFTHHVYFPEFVDMFFDADDDQRQRLWDELRRTNYAAADQDVLDKLYVSIYEDKVLGRTPVQIKSNILVTEAEPVGDNVRLTLSSRLSAPAEHHEYDAVIVATGFRNLGIGEDAHRCPPLLEGLYDRIATNAHGVVDVQRDYRLVARAHDSLPPLFLNGLCESTHGFGDAGSFSLVSLRAALIAESLRDALSPSDLERRAS